MAGTDKIICKNHGGDSYKIAKTLVHNKYSCANRTNDIGVVKIVGNIKFNEKVQPINLSKKWLDGDYDVVLSSWDSKDETEDSDHSLWFEYLKTIDVRNCKELSSHEKVAVYAWNICTVNKKGKGACSAPFGAPLVYNDELVGLLSWSEPCGSGKPDVFTRIAHFYNWLGTVMAILNGGR